MVRYVCLTRCLIREGKSLKTKGNGYLRKNDIVWVNQFKKRRARLVKNQEDGTWEPYGWVTVRTVSGIRLLQQLDDDQDESDTGLWDAAKDIEDRIANIDVTKASATKEKDKVRILNEIKEKVPGGFEMFNLQLIAALKSEWAMNTRQQWG